MNFILATVATLCVTIGVWHFAGPGFLPNQMQTSAVAKSFGASPESKQPESGTTNQVYKCLNGSAVSYSNQPCPKGHRQREVTDTAITVLEAEPASISQTLKPPALPASIPDARALLGSAPNEASLLDKYIDRATQ